MKVTVNPGDGLESILSKTTKELLKGGAEEEDIYECQIIVDEFYANIKSYVFSGSPSLSWAISIFVEQGSVCFVIEYEGPYFHPAPPGPITYKPVDSRPTGGLGLMLVSELSDELSFRYENGVNVITVKKELSQAL